MLNAILDGISPKTGQAPWGGNAWLPWGFLRAFRGVGARWVDFPAAGPTALLGRGGRYFPPFPWIDQHVAMVLGVRPSGHSLFF